MLCRRVLSRGLSSDKDELELECDRDRGLARKKVDVDVLAHVDGAVKVLLHFNHLL